MRLFSIWRRYKFESNSQHAWFNYVRRCGCFQYDEDTSSKAIHNFKLIHFFSIQLFSIWRRYKFESNSQQSVYPAVMEFRCFQYDEDTSSKAIHNGVSDTMPIITVVFNMTKIQVRKQFTTASTPYYHINSCFQYDEDTSSKAIHNSMLTNWTRQ